jgi:hypothetical protein
MAIVYLAVRISVAVTKLVKLHLEAMENSSKAKLDILPEKWEIEREQNQAKEAERVCEAKFPSHLFRKFQLDMILTTG